MLVVLMPALDGIRCSCSPIEESAAVVKNFGAVKDLNTHLSHGVYYKDIDKDHKNFNDIEYMDSPDILKGPTDKITRILTGIRCTHENPGNQLIGLREYYSKHDGTATIETNVHGCTNDVLGGTNGYHLAPGEYWTSVTYRHCGRLFSGIHFETNLGNDVSCGHYDFKDPGPWKDCGGSTLSAGINDHIVGLFGNGNCAAFTEDRGIRGIGLMTLPRNERGS